jgi:hypothetical protein
MTIENRITCDQSGEKQTGELFTSTARARPVTWGGWQSFRKVIMDHPILFSGEMVRAILDGRKTQTRRVIPNSLMLCQTPEDEPDKFIEWCWYGSVGDRLWVREALRRCQDSEGSKPLALYDCDRKPVYQYGYPAEWIWKYSALTGRYMPRWASRITLEITGLRVERLQDITREDARAEGVDNVWQWDKDRNAKHPEHFARSILNPYVANYSVLWDSINAKRGYGWDANPWVWVVSFKRL